MRFFILFTLSATMAYAKPPQSPYTTEVNNEIKALTKSDLEGLRQGSGMPFGGMAKAAELNGYPGPKHILELKQELKLKPEQEKRIKVIFDRMQKKSISIGRSLIAVEKSLDEKFQQKTIDLAQLNALVSRSAQAYGMLRATHLSAHLEAKAVLTEKQVETYIEKRGYNQGDPCKNIPAGHPPEMWKKHHGCN